MHSHDPKLMDATRLSCFSAVGDGMHVELAAEADGGVLVSFREDEALGLQVVLHGRPQDVVLSLADLKRAISKAESEVHRESFYDQGSSEC